MRIDDLESWAYELGFDAVGITPVVCLTEEEKRLRKWLEEGKHGDMVFLEQNIEKRSDPRLLVEGAVSVVVTLTNYYTDSGQDTEGPRIARYAMGKDYHWVLKARLAELLNRMEEADGVSGGRCFTDSAPVFEHEWARRAGLGWRGRNTLLINKEMGSFCLIGVIISRVASNAYTLPFEGNFCGNCRRCIEHCPTGALTSEGLDARRCIAYHTIENKGEYPEDIKLKAGNRIFGCDICQEVCPWNAKARPHKTPEFYPDEDVLSLRSEDWKEMTGGRFKKLFKGTPLERTGLKRLKRNIPGNDAGKTN